MFDRHQFKRNLRDGDPHGRMSDNELNRLADLEQLEWDIALMEDIDDARSILQRIVELVRVS